MKNSQSLALRHQRALHRAVLWAAVLSALWLAAAGPAFAQRAVGAAHHAEAELVGGPEAAPADMPLSSAGSSHTTLRC